MPKNICVRVALQSTWCNYLKCYATSFYANCYSSYVSEFIFTEYCLPNSISILSEEKHTKATIQKKATMSNGKKLPNKKFTKWAWVHEMKWVLRKTLLRCVAICRFIGLVVVCMFRSFFLWIMFMTLIWQQLSLLLPNAIIILTTIFTLNDFIHFISLRFALIHCEFLILFSSCQCSKWKESILSEILRCSLIFSNIHILNDCKIWMMRDANWEVWNEKITPNCGKNDAKLKRHFVIPNRNWMVSHFIENVENWCYFWVYALFFVCIQCYGPIKMRRNQAKVRSSMNITLCGVHDSATDKHIGRLIKLGGELCACKTEQMYFTCFFFRSDIKKSSAHSN